MMDPHEPGNHQPPEDQRCSHHHDCWPTGRYSGSTLKSQLFHGSSSCLQEWKLEALRAQNWDTVFFSLQFESWVLQDNLHLQIWDVQTSPAWTAGNDLQLLCLQVWRGPGAQPSQNSMQCPLFLLVPSGTCHCRHARPQHETWVYCEWPAKRKEPSDICIGMVYIFVWQ